MKKSQIVTLLSLLPILVGCQTGSSNQTTTSSVTTSNITSTVTDSSQISSNVDHDDTLALNGTVATGTAPIAMIPEIDETGLTTTETGELFSTDVDATLTGTYPKGVAITTAKKGKTNVTLNGATIYASAIGAALYSENKITATITLQEGTTNYIYTTSIEDEDNGIESSALKIKGDLIITGKGKLIVVSLNGKGIQASGNITMEEGVDVTVSSGDDAIKAKGNITAEKCSITIPTSKGDGLKAGDDLSSLETDSSIGNITLNDVTYTCASYGDGMQADYSVTIKGGTYNINTHGTWVIYSTENKSTYDLLDDDFKWSKSVDTYKKVSSDSIRSYNGYYALSTSAKGIKVGGQKYVAEDGTETDVASTAYTATITDATINMTTSDSAIKVSYGDCTIDGTSLLNLNAGNKGVAAEHDFFIKDTAKLNVSNSFEGVEAAHLNFLGGTTYISSSDDGVNAATDYTTSDYSSLMVTVDGGNLSIRAEGDGIDSNGDIALNSGLVLVAGPTNSGNGPMDCGDSNSNYVDFNGATVLMVAASGMLETNKWKSSSNHYVIGASANVSNGSSIEVLDSDNNVLMATTCTLTLSGVIIYADSTLAKGKTYSLNYGNNSSSVTVSSTINVSSGGGNFGPGGGGNQPGGDHNPGGRP